jgi:ABC-type antimicrobial peptide transport system permease subunit
MSGYAVVALLLAVAGTYALLAYLVSQRHHEIAIRFALGATTGDVVRLIGQECLQLVGYGILLGLVGAAITSRLLAGLLYGVGALDPIVTGAVMVVAAIAGIAAAIVPARRATRVDPGLALRSGG